MFKKFVATESPLKLMNYVFYLTLKSISIFVLIFWYGEKRLD